MNNFMGSPKAMELDAGMNKRFLSVLKTLPREG
jgi:hypothetical protein